MFRLRGTQSHVFPPSVELEGVRGVEDVSGEFKESKADERSEVICDMKQRHKLKACECFGPSGSETSQQTCY